MQHCPNQTETVALTDSVSVEIPKGKGITTEYANNTNIINIKNGDEVSIMAFNSVNADLGSTFGFAAVKQLMTTGIENEVYQTTINGATVWSIATGNDTTHDNMVISSPDKELTLKIYKSIKYNKRKTVENISKDNNNSIQQDNNKNINSQNTNNNVKTEDNNDVNNNNPQPTGLTRNSIREEPDGSGEQEMLNKKTGEWEKLES